MAMALESGDFIGIGGGLVAFFPDFEGHAVDDFTTFGISDGMALAFGGLAIPPREAIAAKSGLAHEVDILDIMAIAEMIDETAIDGGLEGFALMIRRGGGCSGHGGGVFIQRGASAGSACCAGRNIEMTGFIDEHDRDAIADGIGEARFMTNQFAGFAIIGEG